MVMTKEAAQEELNAIGAQAVQLFGGDAGAEGISIGDTGIRTLSRITAVKGVLPAASTARIDDSTRGVEISQGLLHLPNNVAIKFVLAHELGHSFAHKIIERTKVAGSPVVAEVVADLGAAYLLTELGVGWDDILDVVDGGERMLIFDPHPKDHHPPAKERTEYLRKLRGLMLDGGLDFDAAVKQVVASVKTA